MSRKSNVLIVTGEESQKKELEAILYDKYVTEVCSNGKEAFDYLNNHFPDVCLGRFLTLPVHNHLYKQFFCFRAGLKFQARLLFLYSYQRQSPLYKMYQLPQLGNNKSISKCSTSYKRTLEKCKNLQNITKNTVLTLKSNLDTITL